VNPICVTCGVQYPAGPPPQRCLICEDERQYVGWDGQQWTTLEQMRSKYRNAVTEEEPGLWSIITQPQFAIGQRAFLLQTDAGNILWDCITLLDEPSAAEITARGGLAAIAISHPHYYSSMLEWSRVFGDVPIYLHQADYQWAVRRDGNIHYWSGASRQIHPGVTLIHSPGHFDGFQVLHWAAGAAGRGVLLAGDQPQVAMDRRWVSFLYSYPNMIPLPASAIARIVATLEPWPFDRLYGAFAGRVVRHGAKDAVRRSAERYLRAINSPAP
jgi:hypothetical protein